MNILPSINPKHETEKIVKFLKQIQKKTGINRVVVGLSGGVDSTTVHYLLKKAYKPENIIGVSLPYEKIKPIVDEFITLSRLGEKNPPASFFKEVKVHFLSQSPGAPPQFYGGVRRAKKMVSNLNKIRLGNIIARVRMIILFDLAKKHSALVCGTENKSERLLGYFTRFGDAASDIEPIAHLYKTQVYQLAEYLKLPQKIIDVKPTAGLWKNQTDEGEFGFTYEEADQVLHLYFNKKISSSPVILSDERSEESKDLIKRIKKHGFKNVEKIIKRFLENKFKQEVPYSVFTLR